MTSASDIIAFLYRPWEEQSELLARRADFYLWVCHAPKLPTLAEQLGWIAGQELSVDSEAAMMDRSTGLITQGFQALAYDSMRHWCEARGMKPLAVRFDVTNLRGLNEALPRELGTQFLALCADLARKHLQQAVPDGVWGVRGAGDEFFFVMPVREQDIEKVQAALVAMHQELDTVVRQCGLEHLSHHKHPQDAGWKGVSLGAAMAYADRPLADVQRSLEIDIEADKYRRARDRAQEQAWFTEPRDLTSTAERAEISEIINRARQAANISMPWKRAVAPVHEGQDSLWEEVIREGVASSIAGTRPRAQLMSSMREHAEEAEHHCMRVEMHNLASLNLTLGHYGADLFMRDILAVLQHELRQAAGGEDRIAAFDYGNGVFVFDCAGIPLPEIRNCLTRTAEWVNALSHHTLGAWAKERGVPLTDEGKNNAECVLNQLHHSRDGLNGIGFSAVAEQVLQDKNFSALMNDLDNQSRLQLRKGICFKQEDGAPVWMAVQPADQALGWKEFVKPSRALAEMLLGESLENVLQVQATLLAVHDAYRAAGLTLPDLHAVRNEAALDALIQNAPVSITQGMIERARQAIDPYGGQAVPDAVPRSFEIMEQFAFPDGKGGEAVLIAPEQKSVLLILQAAARVCEDTGRLLEDSVPQLTLRQAEFKHGEMLDPDHAAFNKYSFIDKERDPAVKGAQALMHCADMLLWAVMVARQEGIDYVETHRPVIEGLHDWGVTLFNAMAEQIGWHFGREIEVPVHSGAMLSVEHLLGPLKTILQDVAGKQGDALGDLIAERLDAAQFLMVSSAEKQKT